MVANWITLSRLPLLLICVGILYLGSPAVQLAGVALLFAGLMLDTVDGMVARRMGTTSLLGSVLDIAADRMYELVLWVSFANLDMIPAAIPLLIVARTTLTDALRSIGIAEGSAPFAQHRSPLARFMVASSWMRTGYSITKITAFCGLALAQALPSASLLAVLQPVAWLAVIFCLGRGLPVILAGLPQVVRVLPVVDRS